MLAAVTSGNRKTWQILLPAFQFGSNITGMICRGGFLRLFIHQGFRNGSRRQNLCKKSQNGTFPLKFACMLEKESGFQGEQPPSCVPPASDQGGSTAGRYPHCSPCGGGDPPWRFSFFPLFFDHSKKRGWGVPHRNRNRRDGTFGHFRILLFMKQA